jgi:hypothetical protein
MDIQLIFALSKKIIKRVYSQSKFKIMKKLILTFAIALIGIISTINAQSYSSSIYSTPKYSNYNTTIRTSPSTYSSYQNYHTYTGKSTSVLTNRNYYSSGSYTSATTVYRNNTLRSYSNTSSFSTGNMRMTTTNRYDGKGNYKGTTYKTSYKY